MVSPGAFYRQKTFIAGRLFVMKLPFQLFNVEREVSVEIKVA